MDDASICHHLEQLATHLEIAVRYEPAAGKAGFCTLRGQKTVFVDESLPLRSRAAALAHVLCEFDTEDVFVPPVVRSLLQECRENGLRAATQPALSAGAQAEDETLSLSSCP
jgi:hypothetical protein